MRPGKRFLPKKKFPWPFPTPPMIIVPDPDIGQSLLIGSGRIRKSRQPLASSGRSSSVFRKSRHALVGVFTKAQRPPLPPPQGHAAPSTQLGRLESLAASLLPPTRK